MPVIDEDRDREKEEKNPKKSPASGPSAATKTKDLSHVPCKFYKVGSCTAGSSCPFSHSGITGPGAQKDVCAWFVKGNNCKFGHKCALAHVLPGQSMNMDRKNKKLAQQQAQAGKEVKEGREGREAREGKGRRRDTQARPPTTLSLKSLKASISPSAPAPALNDTDFTSFSALEPDKLPTAPAINGKTPQPKSESGETAPSSPPKRDFGPIGSPPRNTEAVSLSPGTPTNKVLSSSPYKHSMLRSSSGLGASGTSVTSRTGLSMNRSTSSGNSGGLSLGAGVPGGKNPSWGSMGNGSDIGSLPSLPSALLRPLNGIQPHTPLTPASAAQQASKDQVRKDFDLTFEYDEYLGNGPGRATPGRGASSFSEVIVEDDLDDLDDFLPSSLTDLLTPEERKRRMSRGNSSSHQDTHSGLTSPQSYSSRRTLGVPLASRVEGNSTPGGSTPGHRYSRSVPMGDMSHLWANQEQNPLPNPNANVTNVSSSFTGPSSLSANGTGLPSSPPRRIGNGTPGSFTSASGRLAADDYYPYTGGSGSPGSAALGSIGSMGGMGGLNPSNASGAFLPGYGFGTAYIKAKREREIAAAAAAANLVGATQRSVSGGILTNSRMAAGAGMPGTSPGSSGMAYGTPRKEPTGLTSGAVFGSSGIAVTRDFGGIGSMGLTGVGRGALNSMEAAVSPSTRAALLHHAPGQSLPQGLAAGLSRIHAKNLYASSIGMSPGGAGLGFYSGPYGTNRMPSQQSQPQVPPGLGLGLVSGPGYYGNYQQTTPDQPASQSVRNQLQIPSQYNPLNPTFTPNPQTTAAGAPGSSELDVMFSKLAFKPQTSALQTPTQASAPLSYASAASTQSSSSSGTQSKSTGITRNASNASGGAHDDDLFDMDEA
ncbi:hypothetical protein J3R30DRAFT_3678528 [Lentinula aciculospora]|uniref:C3H1-type domain-containing protein n=1 Tax=Lentinula aciculospora TaxID=153920 RepID=A0A9W9ATA9_9AGAR|nr:hypothetical protein J3R30DRAFT_3678528 [Lentinula aciculospora]